MKTLEDLRQFYNASLSTDLKKLEEERKKIARRLILMSVVILCVVGIIIFFLSSKAKTLDIFIFPAVIGAAIWAGLYALLTKNYKKQFKADIIQRIIKFIDANLNYVKDGFIPQAMFIASDIFKRRPDRYRGDDLVNGTIEKTPIEFSEIHAQYKTETRDSKGHRRTQWHTIFKGIFFVAGFNKKFKGSTIVLPDTAEKLFGHIGSMFQSWNMTRDQLIKMDDPEFERLFVVYGSDQIESRYVLSTSLMKRIVDFKKKTGNQIFLSFIQSKVVLAISYRKNLFEPRVFRTLLSFEPIQEYFEDLQLAIGIVGDLNLNTRIWG